MENVIFFNEIMIIIMLL